MIDLEQDAVQVITTILTTHLPTCRFRAFGSRVTGGATRFSDLDLLIEDGNPDPQQLEAARHALSASDLPILIDLVLADDLPETLRRRIEAQARPFP